MNRIWTFLVGQFWMWDTSTFRVFFALSSLLYGTTLFLEPQGFEHPGFRLMRGVAPYWAWAFAFVFHWMLLSLCLMPRFKYFWQINTAVNMFGFLLWGTYIILSWGSSGYVLIGTSMELMAEVFSALTIVRHGFVPRAKDLGLQHVQSV